MDYDYTRCPKCDQDLVSVTEGSDLLLCVTPDCKIGYYDKRLECYCIRSDYYQGHDEIKN
jgi:hypothetical protein